MTQDNRSYTCPWCGRPSDANANNCSSCGSPIDVRGAVSLAEWAKLPAIKDMATFQFQHSFCQIMGGYVPIADFKLAENEGFYFSHHLLLWKDEAVKMKAVPCSLKIAFRRWMAGLPIVMAQVNGPGRLSISKDMPGELIAIPLQKGEIIDVREKTFMAATHSVAYDWLQCGVWFCTSENNGNNKYEIHYPLGRFLDQFSATEGPGMLLLHGTGNIFMRRLEAGQSILIRPTSFLFKESSVKMHLHFDISRNQFGSSNWNNYSQRYTWLQLNGPGRVAIQSHSEILEGQSSNLSSAEPLATIKQW